MLWRAPRRKVSCAASRPEASSKCVRDDLNADFHDVRYTQYVVVTYYTGNHMNAARVESLQLVILKLFALKKEGVHFGRIMTTEEVVAEALEPQTKQLARSENAWTVCGDISKTMFDAMPSADRVALRSNVVGTGNALYLILTQQVKCMQHRFVLPLYDSGVQEFLAHSVNHPFWYSLGEAGGEGAVVLNSSQHHKDLKHVLAIAPKWEPEDKLKAFADLLDATYEITKISFVPSCMPQHHVKSVSTTLVSPAAMSACEEASRGLGKVSL